MKKLTAVFLAFLMCLLCCLGVSAAEEKKLRFKDDGTFRILQINDFQDNHNTDARTLAFLNAVLDKYHPDLVVIVGDQLVPGNGMSVEEIRTALNNELQPMETRGIPFIYTYGNHDHDHDATLDPDAQAAIYDAFSMSYATHNGPDSGTYNNVIYGKDGVTPVLNVYMMDTHNWNPAGWISGVDETQVQWYKETSDALKAQNGGAALPSLLFQHIPVKEMYKFVKEVPQGTPGAVSCPFGDEYYVLDDAAELIGDRNVMKENIASENRDKSTGQYEAWVEQGDIIGAYYGHDHINTFVGRTSDGIVMGYNGGFGFAAYGDGDERFARVYDFKENNVGGYTQKTLYYSEEVSVETTAPAEEPQHPSTENSGSSENVFARLWKSIVSFFRRIANRIKELF